MSRLLTAGAFLAVALAAAYQAFLKTFLHDFAGIGRALQPLSDFPYTCKRLYDKRLEGCEDAWLDYDNRQLFAVCASIEHRLAWNIPAHQLNASAMPVNGGLISVMDIDDPGKDGLYGLRTLNKRGFKGALGDGTITPIGFGAQVIGEDTLRLFITDYAPPVDVDFRFEDPSKPPYNRVSIQIFEHKRGSSSVEFLYEVRNELIVTPNRVTVLPDGGFVVTNDHTHAGGYRQHLEIILGGGNLVRCEPEGKSCSTVIGEGLKLPNGLTSDADGWLYVPESLSRMIRIYEPLPNKTYVERHAFYHPSGLDNFSFDANGDLWIPAIPKISSFLETTVNPYNNTWHTTVWRFRHDKKTNAWESTKILEDVDREVVGGATTVIHDAKTGRLFMIGLMTPFMTICEPK